MASIVGLRTACNPIYALDSPPTPAVFNNTAKPAAIAGISVAETTSAALTISKDCVDCPEMVKLPTSIRIGKYEVTQGQWRAVMGNNPSGFPKCGDNCPGENVSWNDVQTFIEKLNKKSGKSYRLPNGYEWVNACLAGSADSTYCGGNDPDAVAWYSENSGNTPHAIGGRQPNAWGLYDKSGNILEWISSCWDTDCKSRVLRGGSWLLGQDFLRSAYRGGYLPDDRNSNVGFRLAHD